MNEQFSWKKFRGGFWNILIYGVIIALIFGAGYITGFGKSPVDVGYKDFTAIVTEKDGTHHTIAVKNHILYFDGKVVHQSDIPQLRPYGIEFKPKVFFGVGASTGITDGSGEIGIGAQIAHFYKLNLDVFGTQKAIYAGLSYDLSFKQDILSNSSIGIAVGKTWDMQDTRFLVYWAIRF